MNKEGRLPDPNSEKIHLEPPPVEPTNTDLVKVLSALDHLNKTANQLDFLPDYSRQRPDPKTQH
ncbi:MAG TPA: hypothetical protein VD999_07495 [Vitreimonas sp.]|nr:hypothetical protein [Vitreimonas sp.]